MTEHEILQVFRDRGALLQGHFILRSSRPIDQRNIHRFQHPHGGSRVGVELVGEAWMYVLQAAQSVAPGPQVKPPRPAAQLQGSGNILVLDFLGFRLGRLAIFTASHSYATTPNPNAIVYRLSVKLSRPPAGQRLTPPTMLVAGRDGHS